MGTSTKSRRPVKPVSGSCRWVVPLVVGYRPGRLSITSQTRRGPVTTEYTVREITDAGRVVGYSLRKDDGTTHDVDADLWQCDCLDFLNRAAEREAAGLPPACKHVKSLRAALKRCPVLI